MLSCDSSFYYLSISLRSVDLPVRLAHNCNGHSGQAFACADKSHPLLRRPLTLTSASAIPSAQAIRAHISCRYGDIFGCSQESVASTEEIVKPASRRIDAVRVKSSAPDRPRKRSSLSGKWNPMSPSAAAPSSASATACASTSASLCPCSPFSNGISTQPSQSSLPATRRAHRIRCRFASSWADPPRRHFDVCAALHDVHRGAEQFHQRSFVRDGQVCSCACANPCSSTDFESPAASAPRTAPSGQRLFLRPDRRDGLHTGNHRIGKRQTI